MVNDLTVPGPSDDPKTLYTLIEDPGSELGKLSAFLEMSSYAGFQAQCSPRQYHELCCCPGSLQAGAMLALSSSSKHSKHLGQPCLQIAAFPGIYLFRWVSAPQSGGSKHQQTSRLLHDYTVHGSGRANPVQTPKGQGRAKS